MKRALLLIFLVLGSYVGYKVVTFRPAPPPEDVSAAIEELELDGAGLDTESLVTAGEAVSGDDFDVNAFLGDDKKAATSNEPVSSEATTKTGSASSDTNEAPTNPEEIDLSELSLSIPE